jgi:hypothetical protein
MKNLYEVTAIRPKRIRTSSGMRQAPYGFIAHQSYQVARSENEAIELAKIHMTPEQQKLPARATWIRETD